MSNTQQVSEQDKPFILALVASGITILNGALAALGAYLGNQLMVSTCVDILKYTFTLTAMAWTFYFGAKGTNNK